MAFHKCFNGLEFNSTGLDQDKEIRRVYRIQLPNAERALKLFTGSFLVELDGNPVHKNKNKIIGISVDSGLYSGNDFHRIMKRNGMA